MLVITDRLVSLFCKGNISVWKKAEIFFFIGKRMSFKKLNPNRIVFLRLIIHIFFVAELVLALATVSCTTTNETEQQTFTPVWYTVEGLEEVYPLSLYIREIGSGKTRQDAENNAVSYISRYLETETSYSSESILSAVTTDDDTTITETTDIRTLITSNIKLFGIQYSDNFYNKKEKEYYVVAYIDREKAWNQYEPELRVEKDKFMAYYTKAQKESDAFHRIRMLNDALDAGKGFNEKLAFANTLSKRLTDKNFASDVKTLATLSSMIKQELLSNPIFISVDDDFNGIIAGAVREVFVQKSFAVTADKSNATYIAQINVNYNRDFNGNRVVLNPFMSLSLVGNSGSIYTTGVESPRVVAPNEQAAKKIAANDLSVEIEKKLPDDLKNSLGL